MSRHTHDDELSRRTVDYAYVRHHAGGEPGLLMVRGVPAETCVTCEEYWFDEDTGLARPSSQEKLHPDTSSEAPASISASNVADMP